MSTFICEKCGCIDNSALGGTYWAASLGDREDILCQQCNLGSWHNMFPKKHWSKFGNPEELVKMFEQDKGSFSNAKQYFKSNNT